LGGRLVFESGFWFNEREVFESVEKKKMLSFWKKEYLS
jgi:hypothetical protein